MRRPEGSRTKRLNVYLLKQSVANFEDALAKPDDWQNNAIDLTVPGAIAKLYGRSRDGKKADWVKMLEKGLPQGAVTPFKSSFSCRHSALLLLKIDGRYFALCFGFGGSLLRSDCWEPRFGLRIALNLADSANLRQAAFRSHEGRTLTREVSSSRLTGFYDLGFDSERDFVRRVTAKLKNHALGMQLTGKDSVSLLCPASIEDLADKCRELKLKSEDQSYKQNFPEIENVVLVEDDGTKKALLVELDLQLAAKNDQQVHFAIPDILDQERLQGLSILGSQDLVDWLAFDTLEQYLEVQALTLAHLKSVTVHAVDVQGNEMGGPWTLLQCCIAEIQLDGQTYLLAESEWLRCEATYIAELNRYIDGIPLSNVLSNLPRRGAATETDYLTPLETTAGHGFIVAHKQNVMHGGGRSRIEVCDLLDPLSTPVKLVHIKGGGGATEFGHLALQGLASAELLTDEDDSFRVKTLEKLQNRAKENGVALPQSLPTRGSDYHVVYAVFCETDGAASQRISLFGKISLRRAVRTLRKFQCKVTLELLTP